MTRETLLALAARLSSKQREALVRWPLDTPATIGGKITYCRSWIKASEVGAKGGTVASMQCFGGVDEKTFLAGPCLVTDDWSREGRMWALSDLGHSLAVHLRAACLVEGEGK